MSTTSGLKWFKSSYSGGDGDNCIEVALDAEAIHIRDSKDPRITPSPSRRRHGPRSLPSRTRPRRAEFRQFRRLEFDLRGSGRVLN